MDICRRRHHEAIPCYDAALAHQPSNAKTWFCLGISFFAISHFLEAEHAYMRAMQARSLSKHPPADQQTSSVNKRPLQLLVRGTGNCTVISATHLQTDGGSCNFRLRQKTLPFTNHSWTGSPSKIQYFLVHLR